MGRYLMDKAFDMIRDLVTGLTCILVGVIGRGVLQQLGDAGIVGLLAAALLYKLLK